MDGLSRHASAGHITAARSLPHKTSHTHNTHLMVSPDPGVELLKYSAPPAILAVLAVALTILREAETQLQGGGLW